MRDVWQEARKSAPIRKPIGWYRQIPRAWRRSGVREQDFVVRPPVLCNSFPKSGTNLLLQALQAVPGLVSYGSVIASTPTLTYRERTREAHRQLLERIVPGELVFAHLYHDVSYAESLARKHCIHFFIYRDLRDVVVSEAHYLTHMNRWHRLHHYFAKQKSCDEERLSAAILGATDDELRIEFPDVGRRFKRYEAWLNDPDVLEVRFEDVVSGRHDAFQEMAKWWRDRSGSDCDVSNLADQMRNSVDPAKSPTFRRGHVGTWREVFTDRHKAELKAAAGDLLVRLGYETNHDW